MNHHHPYSNSNHPPPQHQLHHYSGRPSTAGNVIHVISDDEEEAYSVPPQRYGMTASRSQQPQSTTLPNPPNYNYHNTSLNFERYQQQQQTPRLTAAHYNQAAQAISNSLPQSSKLEDKFLSFANLVTPAVPSYEKHHPPHVDYNREQQQQQQQQQHYPVVAKSIPTPTTTPPSQYYPPAQSSSSANSLREVAPPYYQQQQRERPRPSFWSQHASKSPPGPTAEKGSAWPYSRETQPPQYPYSQHQPRYSDPYYQPHPAYEQYTPPPHPHYPPSHHYPPAASYPPSYDHYSPHYYPQPAPALPVSDDLLLGLKEVSSTARRPTQEHWSYQSSSAGYPGEDRKSSTEGKMIDGVPVAPLTSPKGPRGRQRKDTVAKPAGRGRPRKDPATKKPATGAGRGRKKKEETTPSVPAPAATSQNVPVPQPKPVKQRKQAKAAADKPKAPRTGLRTRTAAQQKKQKQYMKLLDDEYDPMDDDDYSSYYQQREAAKKKNASKRRGSKKAEGTTLDPSDSEASTTDLEDFLEKQSVFKNSDNFCFSNGSLDVLSNTVSLVCNATSYITDEMKNRLQERLDSKNNNLLVLATSSAEKKDEQDQIKDVKEEEQEQQQVGSAAKVDISEIANSIIDLSVYNCVRFDGINREKKLEEIQKKKRSLEQSEDLENPKTKKRRVSKSKAKPSTSTTAQKISKSKLKRRSGLDVYEVLCASELKRIPDTELAKESLTLESAQALADAQSKQNQEIATQLKKREELYQDTEKDTSQTGQLPNIPSIHYYLTNSAENGENLSPSESSDPRKKYEDVAELFQQTPGYNSKNKVYRLDPQQLVTDVYSLAKRDISTDLRIICNKKYTPSEISKPANRSTGVTNQYADRDMFEYDTYIPKQRGGRRSNNSMSAAVGPNTATKKSNRGRTTKNSNRDQNSPKHEKQEEPVIVENKKLTDIQIESAVIPTTTIPDSQPSVSPSDSRKRSRAKRAADAPYDQDSDKDGDFMEPGYNGKLRKRAKRSSAAPSPSARATRSSTRKHAKRVLTVENTQNVSDDEEEEEVEEESPVTADTVSPEEEQGEEVTPEENANHEIAPVLNEQQSEPESPPDDDATQVDNTQIDQVEQQLPENDEQTVLAEETVEQPVQPSEEPDNMEVDQENTNDDEATSPSVGAPDAGPTTPEETSDKDEQNEEDQNEQDIQDDQERDEEQTEQDVEQEEEEENNQDQEDQDQDQQEQEEEDDSDDEVVLPRKTTSRTRRRDSASYDQSNATGRYNTRSSERKVLETVASIQTTPRKRRFNRRVTSSVDTDSEEEELETKSPKTRRVVRRRPQRERMSDEDDE